MKSIAVLLTSQTLRKEIALLQMSLNILGLHSALLANVRNERHLDPLRFGHMSELRAVASLHDFESRLVVLQQADRNSALQ